MIRGLSYDLAIGTRRLMKELVGPVMGQIDALVPREVFGTSRNARYEFLKRVRSLVLRLTQLVSAGNMLRTAQEVVRDYNKRQGLGNAVRPGIRADKGQSRQLVEYANATVAAIERKDLLRVVLNLCLIIHRSLSLANTFGIRLDDFFIEVAANCMRRGSKAKFGTKPYATGRFESVEGLADQFEMERRGATATHQSDVSLLSEIETVLAHQASRTQRVALASTVGRTVDPGIRLFDEMNPHLDNKEYFARLAQYLKSLDVRALTPDDLPQGMVEGEHYVIEGSEVRLLRTPARHAPATEDFDRLLNEMVADDLDESDMLEDERKE